jgi:hypothetical protein
MRYEVNADNFEIYFWDDVNSDPYQYQPTYPNGDTFDSVEEATAWAEASLAAHNPEVGFYAPNGKGLEPEAKPNLAAKEELINVLGLTPEELALLRL